MVGTAKIDNSFEEFYSKGEKKNGVVAEECDPVPNDTVFLFLLRREVVKHVCELLGKRQQSRNWPSRQHAWCSAVPWAPRGDGVWVGCRADLRQGASGATAGRLTATTL